MPREFTRTLNDPAEVTGPVPERVPDTPLTDLGEAVKSAGEVLSEMRDEKVVETLNEDTSQLQAQVGDYLTTQRNLRRQLSTADADTAANIEREIIRLQNGMQQGRVSPVDAHIKLRTLVNQKIRQHPHLAKEIRMMYTAASEGVNAVVSQSGKIDETDPAIRVDLAVIELANKMGVPPAIAREKMQAEQQLAAVKVGRELAQENGLEGEFEIRSEVSAYIAKSVTDVYIALAQAQQQGRVIPRKELFKLGRIGEDAAQQIDLLLTQREREVRGEGGRLTWRDEFRRELKEEVKNRLGGIERLVNAMDTEKAQRELLAFTAEQLKVKGIQDTNKLLGWLAPLMSLPNGMQIWQNVADKFPLAMKGQLSSIQIAADQGDPNSIAFLELWKNGGFQAMQAKDAANIVSGNDPGGATGNSHVDTARVASAWQIAIDPKVGYDERVKMLEFFIKTADEGIFGANYKRALDNPKTRQLIVQSPTLVNAVRARSEQRGVRAVDIVNPKAATLLKYDSATKLFSVDEMIAPGTTVLDSDRELARNAANALNLASKGKQLIGDDVDSWAKGIFDTMSGKKSKVSISDLAEKAPAEPNNRTGTIAGRAEERLYDKVFGEYFDMTNPMRPKLKPGKTAKQASDALRATFGGEGGVDFSNATLEEIAAIENALNAVNGAK